MYTICFSCWTPIGHDVFSMVTCLAWEESRLFWFRSFKKQTHETIHRNCPPAAYTLRYCAKKVKETNQLASLKQLGSLVFSILSSWKSLNEIGRGALSKILLIYRFSLKDLEQIQPIFSSSDMVKNNSKMHSWKLLQGFGFGSPSYWGAIFFGCWAWMMRMHRLGSDEFSSSCLVLFSGMHSRYIDGMVKLE